MTSLRRPRTLSTLIALLAVAAVARAVVALLTAVPSRDATHYLFLAERAVDGEPAELFRSVFHPGFPLLIAAVLPIFPGLAPFRAGQAASAGAGVLAVVPLFFLARRLTDQRGAVWTCLMYAVGTWFCRHPADVLSEGPFYLCVAAWGERLVGPASTARATAAGLLAALAYACRPEGALLVVVASCWLWAHRSRTAAVAAAAAFCIAAAPLPAGWALWGDGFTLTPKAAFNLEVGIGSAEHGAWSHYAGELTRLPGALCEGIGFAAFPLALIGAVSARRRTPLGDWRVLLLAPLAAQCAVVPMLQSHHRFLTGFGVLTLPFAAHAVLWVAHRMHGKPIRAALAGCAFLGLDLARLPQSRGEERRIERALGAWLAARLHPGEQVASDMPRLVYFAGRRPPQPRRIPGAQILREARRPEVRVIALVRSRTSVPDEALRQLGFAPLELPEPLRRQADARDVAVFGR